MERLMGLYVSSTSYNLSRPRVDEEITSLGVTNMTIHTHGTGACACARLVDDDDDDGDDGDD